MDSRNDHSLEYIADLREQFPISGRFVVQKSWGWVLACLALVFLYFWKESPGNPLSRFVSDIAGMKFRIWYIILASLTIWRILYAWLYRGTFYFGIERASLLISKGIFVRNQGNLPFGQITDIFVKRNLHDFMFGLSSIVVSSASDYSEEFASIEGLSRSTALDLQRYLRSLLEKYQLTKQDIGKAASYAPPIRENAPVREDKVVEMEPPAPPPVQEVVNQETYMRDARTVSRPSRSGRSPSKKRRRFKAKFWAKGA